MIVITLEGIEKIKTENEMTTKQSDKSRVRFRLSLNENTQYIKRSWQEIANS